MIKKKSIECIYTSNKPLNIIFKDAFNEKTILKARNKSMKRTQSLVGNIGSINKEHRIPN